MESQDLVSVSRIVSRPSFESLSLGSKVSGLESYRSLLQAYCLETLIIARILLSKTSLIQRVFPLLYL